ncbi:hypothetical protein [Nonomuraea diastatica]|uniref:Uncharacterized protein n=1 Tax=Nonomuraea diastatica TaxID=1848329 RepID=A0A4R4X6E4_9ACTN|nr:hypothetical protein [Nonomuraea diastatica]TDD25963.1 hypothetical protein E1294_01570 [Nonomuraea diastatica]
MSRPELEIPAATGVESVIAQTASRIAEHTHAHRMPSVHVILHGGVGRGRPAGALPILYGALAADGDTPVASQGAEPDGGQERAAQVARDVSRPPLTSYQREELGVAGVPHAVGAAWPRFTGG